MIMKESIKSFLIHNKSKFQQSLRQLSQRTDRNSDMEELENMEVGESQPYISDDTDDELSQPLQFSNDTEPVHNCDEDEEQLVSLPFDDEIVEITKPMLPEGVATSLKEELESELNPEEEIALDQEPEPVVVEEEVQPSLLNNQPYMSLVKQCCNIYDELSRISEQTSDEDMLHFIQVQQGRIREALVLSGGRLIDEETEFNLLRHTPVPTKIVNNGHPISSTLEAGVEIEDRVIIKAKVVLGE